MAGGRFAPCRLGELTQLVPFEMVDEALKANQGPLRGRAGHPPVQAVEGLSAPVASKTYGDLYFANHYGRLLALDRRTGAVRWHTASLNDPGDSADETTPTALLLKDAIVAVAGGTVFSVCPTGA